MKCPDCKIEMLWNEGNGDWYASYYKCPRCRMEIDESDEEYKDKDE